MRLKTIVALTDFSAQAEHSLERAALMARAHEAQLRILYGAEVPHPKFDDPFARLEQRGRQIARRYGIPVKTLLARNNLDAKAVLKPGMVLRFDEPR